MSENKTSDKQVPSSYGSAAVTPGPLRTVETPRTDAVFAIYEDQEIRDHRRFGQEFLALARQLERELAARTMELAALRKVNAALSNPSARGESKEQLLAQFEQWYSMTLPLFEAGGERLKHQLWTAWQVAHLKSPYVGEKK